MACFRRGFSVYSVRLLSAVGLANLRFFIGSGCDSVFVGFFKAFLVVVVCTTQLKTPGNSRGWTVLRRVVVFGILENSIITVKKFDHR